MQNKKKLVEIIDDLNLKIKNLTFQNEIFLHQINDLVDLQGKNTEDQKKYTQVDDDILYEFFDNAQKIREATSLLLLKMNNPDLKITDFKQSLQDFIAEFDSWQNDMYDDKQYQKFAKILRFNKNK